MDGKIKIFHLFYRILSIEFFSSLFLCIPEKSNIYIQTKWEPTIKAHTRTQIILKWISCYFFFLLFVVVECLGMKSWLDGRGRHYDFSFFYFIFNLYPSHSLSLSRSLCFILSFCLFLPSIGLCSFARSVLVIGNRSTMNNLNMAPLN